MGVAALRVEYGKRAGRPVPVARPALLPGDCTIPGYEIAGAGRRRVGLPSGALVSVIIEDGDSGVWSAVEHIRRRPGEGDGDAGVAAIKRAPVGGGACAGTAVSRRATEFRRGGRGKPGSSNAKVRR